jgi:twinkle protein
MTTFDSLGIDTKGKSGRFYVTCPKCSSDRKKSKIPCLTVNSESGNNWFKCQHCTFSGNLEAYDKYNKIRERSKYPSVIPDIYGQDAMSMLFIPKGIKAVTAKNRGIYEIAPFSHETKGQVAFPYFYQGNLVNVKFRRLEYGKSITLPNGEERYLSKNWQIKKEDGAKVCYWGLNRLDFEISQDLIICEGEMDALTWDEAGFSNALSVPNGAINEADKNFDEKLEFAKDEWVVKNVYARARRVFLALDDDGSGRRMRDELAAIIGKSKCYIIEYGGRKDINEVHAGEKSKNLEALGVNGVQLCFENAKPYPVGGIITFDMIEKVLDSMSADGFKRGFTLNGEFDSTGVDKYLSIKKPYLAVITGIPSMGKSSWWRWYMTRQSMKNSVKWGLFVPDSRPEEREIAKICEIMVGAKWELNKPWSMTAPQRLRAKEFVREYFYLIKPDKRNSELIARISQGKQGVKGLDSLFYYLETLKRQYNIFGYCFDAWNKVEHQKPSGITDEAFVSQQLDRVLEFNEEVGLFGSIIAHPTKLEKIKGSRNYDAPDLYNVKGSSAWYEKADIGISIHRYKYKKVQVGTEGKRAVYREVRDNSAATQVIINKIKQNEIGEEGDFEMFMDWRAAETFVYSKPDYYDEAGDGDFNKQIAEKQAEKPKATYDGPLIDYDVDKSDGEDIPFDLNEDLPF